MVFPRVTLPTLREHVREKIAAIEAPPGYTIEWGGEYEDTIDAQASLVPGVIPALAVIGFIIVGLFNAFRPPLVIVCTIPFALIGISAGLLATNTPFGFLALLGAMSLAGMMIKNAIVLLDEINLNREAGMTPYDAVVMAALSRLRPVALAAATTCWCPCSMRSSTRSPRPPAGKPPPRPRPAWRRKGKGSSGRGIGIGGGACGCQPDGAVTKVRDEHEMTVDTVRCLSMPVEWPSPTP
jgi:hypothetical protein